MSIEFLVMGQAIPKGSSKAITLPGETKTRIVGANSKTKRWEQTVAVCAMRARGARTAYLGPVTVILHFHLRRPKGLARQCTVHLKKPDTDKLTRAVLDGLRGILFRDDAQVIALHAYKSYAVGEECTTVFVMEGPYGAQDEQAETDRVHAAYGGHAPGALQTARVFSE